VGGRRPTIAGCEYDRIAANRAIQPDHLQFATVTEWEEWLADNHAVRTEAWMKIAKKGSGVETIRYPEVLDVAICFGWIDAVRHAHDETFFLQRFTPRGPRSKWSQVNRQKATELIECGRMHPAGLAQVEAAQADGRWEAAYEPQSRATVPDDFQHALDQSPAAAEFFATLTGMRRYAFLYRLQNTRTPDARERRIAGYIELLSEGRTLN
jgi:uncharacterized protein YdeI (YjbR/CyaY-like superfamily)